MCAYLHVANRTLYDMPLPFRGSNSATTHSAQGRPARMESSPSLRFATFAWKRRPREIRGLTIMVRPCNVLLFDCYRQAAFGASICRASFFRSTFTVLEPSLPISMRRGFSASGISRWSSMVNRPSCNEARATLT